MNIVEALEFAIETSESGRPGAAVKILQSIIIAMKDGKETNFFETAERKQLAALAQELAFIDEKGKKEAAIGETFVQEECEEPDCVA